MSLSADEPGSPSFLQTLKEYRVVLAFASLSLLLIIFALVLLIKSAYSSNPIQFSSAVATESASAVGRIKVDVAGAVVHPGVYELAPGSRVEDAIIRAGGLSQTADEAYLAKVINRAAVMSDGMKVYIPSINSDQPSHNSYCTTSECKTSYNLDSSQNVLGSATADLISINLASQAQLESLPGVGPVTAQKIISNRPYSDLPELVSKKAVGQSLFEKIKDKLIL